MATFLHDPDANFLSALLGGVPLGVNEVLAPSPAWPLHKTCSTDHERLLDHLDSWKSARDHPDLVDVLIAEELAAGFIAHVPCGVTQLKQMYSRTAIGKLGLVLAPNRSPRLVVNSSISNVTVNTHIPNHVLLPRISDVMSCAPSHMARQEMIQLALDVAEAHSRILIAPQGTGMLCFYANGEFYRCVTLNFGARASGWYWGRVAGLMVRLSHSLFGHHHALWQYVDDLLARLDRQSAPLWVCLLVLITTEARQ